MDWPWPITAVGVGMLFDPEGYAIQYVATLAGILGDILGGWFVGKDNVKRRLMIAAVVLIAWVGLLFFLVVASSFVMMNA